MGLDLSISGSLCLFLFLWSCSRPTFSGSAKLISQPTIPAESDANAVPAKCGDKVTIRWDGKAKECIIDKGKIFDFGTNTCTSLKASPYECTWKNVTTELTKLEFDVESKLKAKQNDGSHLIACGFSEDTLMTVFQWVKLPDSRPDDCAYDMSQIKIQTECYEYDLGPDPVEQPKTEIERNQKVYECLRKVKE